MALSDFFRINLPYGLKRVNDGTWLVFNREQMPLGWNTIEGRDSLYGNRPYSDLPIHTRYQGLTEGRLKRLAHSESSVRYGDDGKIDTIFLYNDASNPQSNPQHWNQYFDKIRTLSSLQVKVKKYVF